MTLQDWLNEAVAAPRVDGNSRHIDELANCAVSAVEGPVFLAGLLEIIARCVHHLRAVPDDNWRCLLLYAPLGPTEELKFGNNDVWSDLRLLDEPPSLYLLLSDDVFGHAYEEYRRPLRCPVEFTYFAGFRSFRPADHIDPNWQFSNGIYFLVERSLL